MFPGSFALYERAERASGQSLPDTGFSLCPLFDGAKQLKRMSLFLSGHMLKSLQAL
jgi:hypothetical protein